jgi:hypothetical protein
MQQQRQQQQQHQQQQQTSPRQVRFPPPFASINNPLHNDHLHKPHWLHNPFHHSSMEQTKLAANFSGTWIKVRFASLLELLQSFSPEVNLHACIAL